MSPTTETVHVRGHSAFTHRAGLGIRAGVLLADLAIAVAVSLVALRVVRVSPTPRIWWLGLVFSLFLALWIGQRLFFRRTLGEAFWQLQVHASNQAPLRGKLFQPDRLPTSTWLFGIILTEMAWASAFVVAYGAFWNHPLFIRASTWDLQPFLPPVSAMQVSLKVPVPGQLPTTVESEEWIITPFFYTMGAWPKTFHGRPVFYSLPYEKGPPIRFIGHIFARWDGTDTRVTFEGPKTPLSRQNEKGEIELLSRNRIRECLGTLRLDCLGVRERVLLRHIEGIRAAVPNANDWSLRWFEVDNPSIPEQERAQGFYISGASTTRAQDRFVVITPKGTHQAFILDSPQSSTGQMARVLFAESVRSLRVSDELAEGRAWIDHEIESIRIDDLKTLAKTPGMINRLAEIQALLISKISVDPRTYDSYFHLGNTELMLMRFAVKNQDVSVGTDWSALAKPMIQNVYRYAKDLAATDPRTAQLQNLWMDAQKY